MSAIKPVNSTRRRESHDRNFGPRAKAVRAMDCVCVPALQAWLDDGCPDLADPPTACMGDIQACHDTARGMGGCNSSSRELFPGCFNHHDAFGAKGSTKRLRAEARYDVNITKTVERIAAELDARMIP